MTEEMIDIENYEGLYAITRDGKVWSYKSNKFLKPILTRNGYCQVNLYKDGKIKREYIHRLVAFAFLDNPNNLSDVNHIDEDKTNNNVNNLEWLSHKDNINYGTRTKRVSKPIYCVELDRVFDGAKQAARELSLSQGNITSCCKGRYKTTGGYHFKYAETSVEEI